MPEVAFAGEDHGDPGGVGGGDDGGVVDRAAGLDDGADPGPGGDLDAVGIGEEAVAGQHAAIGP